MQKGTISKALPIVIVLAISMGIAAVLIKTGPQASMGDRSVPRVPVEVMVAEPVEHQVIVQATGTVVPARELQISPEVSGRIVSLHPDLIPGSHITRGEVIARINSRDYETAVTLARARLQEAESVLAIERGRQDIARQEFKLMQESLNLTPENADLTLRKPQLANTEALVLSARSSLAQAELNLERTIIRVPFNAVVKTKMVEVGKVVTAQTPLATLVGTDHFWVIVNVPTQQLPFIEIPSKRGKAGARTRIAHDIGGQVTIRRNGHVIGLMSDLSPVGRLARVLVQIDDPLDLKNDLESRSLPLLIDAFVNVEINGPVLDEIYIVPREAIREGNSLWIMNDEDKLEMRSVSIHWRREKDVLVDRGLLKGDRIVTSALPAPMPGMLLKAVDRDRAQPDKNIM